MVYVNQGECKKPLLVEFYRSTFAYVYLLHAYNSATYLHFVSQKEKIFRLLVWLGTNNLWSTHTFSHFIYLPLDSFLILVHWVRWGWVNIASTKTNYYKLHKFVLMNLVKGMPKVDEAKTWVTPYIANVSHFSSNI